MAKGNKRAKRVDVTKILLQPTSVADYIYVQVSASRTIQAAEEEMSPTKGSEAAFALRREGKLDSSSMKLCNNWRQGLCHNQSACSYAHLMSFFDVGESSPTSGISATTTNNNVVQVPQPQRATPTRDVSHVSSAHHSSTASMESQAATSPTGHSWLAKLASSGRDAEMKPRPPSWPAQAPWGRIEMEDTTTPSDGRDASSQQQQQQQPSNHALAGCEVPMEAGLTASLVSSTGTPPSLKPPQNPWGLSSSSSPPPSAAEEAAAAPRWCWGVRGGNHDEMGLHATEDPLRWLTQQGRDVLPTPPPSHGITANVKKHLLRQLVGDEEELPEEDEVVAHVPGYAHHNPSYPIQRLGLGCGALAGTTELLHALSGQPAAGGEAAPASRDGMREVFGSGKAPTANASLLRELTMEPRDGTASAAPPSSMSQLMSLLTGGKE